MSSAHYSVQGNVAVITLDNPPVNGLGFESRSEVLAGLERANADTSIQSIVLIGARNIFSGGADIRQFNTPKYWAYPRTIDLATRIDELHKPTVAAVEGFAMGGGLELALACHYRVAAPGARLALPEVKLGLLPGGGGTFRLPRLIGVEFAVDMMLSGEPVSADQAQALGLVDRIISSGLLDGAISFAQEVAALGGAGRHTPFEDPMRDLASYFERKREELGRERNPGPARATILACIEASMTMPHDYARKVVDAATAQLMDSNESKALRHIFFAERQAKRSPGMAGGASSSVGARLMESLHTQCLALTEIGLDPQQIDAALTDWGMSRRPCTEFGIYSTGDRGEVLHHEIPQQEIIDRCVFSLVNEGARILSEGGVPRASDIDLTMVKGYGFPAMRGGPMFHADRIGLVEVLSVIESFRSGYRGELWEPAPLLLERAGEPGGRFNQ